MAPDATEAIKSEVESNKMILYMKGTPAAPQCGFSAATVEILNGYGHTFKTVDILANPDVREKLPQYSNWPTFPQLFVGGKFVGGCDIVHELRDSGELEKIIKKAFGS